MQVYSHNGNVRSLETTPLAELAAVCKRSVTKLTTDQWLLDRILTPPTMGISSPGFKTVYIIFCFLIT
jgi:hypothetical protein